MTDKMLRSALAYADMGWRLHPLRPGDKRPLLNAWPEKATTDPDTIRQWWEQWPRANIGLATGDLVAVDLDIKNGAGGLQAWDELTAQLGLDVETLTSRTPSGGLHLIFAANGAAVGNSAGKLGPGIDTRGRAGYVILPPSALDDGAGWRWDEDHHPAKMQPATLPDALARLLQEPARGAGGGIPVTNGGAYALGALDGELATLGQASPGGRNHALNVAAFSLGQFVGGGHLDRGDVRGQLEAAGVGLGLPLGEVRATVRSGLDAGEKEPRTVPARATVTTSTPAPTWAPGTTTEEATAPHDFYHLPVRL